MGNINNAAKGFIEPDKKIINIIFLQFSIFVLSFSSVIAKKASYFSVSSSWFWILFGLEVAIFGVYAIIWQQVIKNYEISVAYANKGTQLIWTLIWAALFFNEHITLTNILGTIIIVMGIVLVHKDV
jgi:uncharacterized membrane protein